MLDAVGSIAGDHELGLVVLTCAIGVLASGVLCRTIIRRRSTKANRFRALTNAAIEGLIFEQNGYIRDVNPAMCAMLDTQAGALVGRKLTALIRGLTLTPADQPGEYDLIQADGGYRPVEVVWRDGDTPGNHVVAVRELSIEKAAQHQSQRLARLDPLTGLGNRELFEYQLQKTLALSNRATVGVAVLSIELDGFAHVRDAVGPLAADQIIIHVARRLLGCVREMNTIARLGPDDFGIVQPLADKPADAAALAERIITEMALPFEPCGRPITISASIGVALYPGDGATAAELIKGAARALGRARQDGPGTWRYVEPDMDVTLRETRSLEHDLRTALRNGRLMIAYQPFFDAATMETAGFEALLRWDHPQRGSIPPAVFLPVAEACGLIAPIGRWVLATACAEAAAWPHPVTLAVNLSPAQLVQGLVGTVAEVLRESGLAANRLELEITEAPLMDDTQNVLRILTELKALGVRIVLDDFGTGCSSLSLLRRFPFDKIKIDRSFLGDVEDDAEAETLIQAIIALGRGLQLEVTAEGVETAQQLASLQALGCGFVQGYLLGGPGAARFPDGRGEAARLAGSARSQDARHPEGAAAGG